MKLVSSKLHVRLATQLLGAVFALACGSTDPTRSSPSAKEHNDSPDLTTGSDQPDVPASDASANARNAPDGSSGATGGSNAGSRVVGYLPTYRSLVPSDTLDTLTHLTLAFAAPTIDHRIDFVGVTDEVRGQIKKLVSAAHDTQKKVKVLGAIGGGDAGVEGVPAALKDNPSEFVKKTITFLETYELDGIDIDIEGTDIDADTYEALVNGLVDALQPKGKLVTAAVGSWKSENYRALDKVDFLNVMSYDTWCDPQVNDGKCEHASYEQAKTDLKFWSTDYWSTPGRGAYNPANVVLGVPFFGHCSSRAADGGVCQKMVKGIGDDVARPRYNQVLKLWNELHPGKLVPDLIQDDETGDYLSLNGPETIELKAKLAKSYGGIMIWELGQDATGENSLFSAIKKAQKPSRQ